MRPAEISDQDVIQAGQELIAAGRRVNAYALRTKTGGGNPQRLVKVWEEHLMGHVAAPVAPVISELPLEMAEELAAVTKALGERMAALISSLNQQAVQAAERRVQQLQRLADEQSAKDKAELADASVLVNDLQAKLSQAETDLEANQKTLADARALLEGQTGEVKQLGEQLATQAAQSQQDREGHADELARLNTLLEDERREHQDAVEMQRDELLEQGKNASDAREVMAKEVATAKADAAGARQVLAQQEASMQERLQAVEKKSDQASQATSGAREKAARLEGQVETLQAQVRELMRVIASRLAVQDAKDGIAANTGQANATRLTPENKSPTLPS